ncbi:MAG: hypothetical protein AAGC67_01240 [Myxococcota bacterium]
MSQWIWIGVNGVVGLGLAAWLVVAARELLRTALAPLLGFRVFELRFGVGARRFARAVGPIDLVLAPWPVAGATIARSGAARRHRLGRALLACGPIAGQLAWLLGRLAQGIAPGAAPLFEGPAPLACLDLANALLLVAHATFALELEGGVRTDVRLLLDAWLGRADSNRAARADHYARLARHRLERAQVEAARAALDQGLRQLGPQSLLVAAERHFLAADLDSVVDQGACADAIGREIEAADPRRRRERASWSRVERLRQGLASAIPVALALWALAFVQADSWARHLEAGMLALGDRAVAAADTRACTRLIDTWADWSARIDPWLPPSDAARSERHRSLAALERCRGAEAMAAAHHGEALLAARAATASTDPHRLTEADDGLADELRVTALLRETAGLASRQGRHRDALRTLHQAERRLGQVERRLPLIGDERTQGEARTRIAHEREAIGRVRSAALARMRGGV